MTVQDDGRRRFGADTRGAIAVTTALLLPVLIGIAAYAVDASLLLYRQERLQIAADIGARAGAEWLARGESDARAIALAETMVAANTDAPSGTVPVVNVTLPEPGRLSIETSLQVPRIFSQLFGRGALTVAAGSRAAFETAAAPVVCLYLDDPRANRALRLRRDSRLTMDGCTLGVASDHGRAVTLDRGAALRADCLDVAGGISGIDRITLAACATPRTGVPVALPTDFARLADTLPRPAGGCADPEDDGAGTADGAGDTPNRITPTGSHPSGMREIRFCDDVEIDRDTVGGPGLYFFEDGLEIADGITLTLEPGSVIVLLDDADIDIGSDAILRLAPPASGPLAGVAVMAGDDRDRDADLDLDIGRLDVEGILVFPGEKLTLRGQNADAGCLRILAGALELDRDGVIVGGCTGGGGTGGGGTVRLMPRS